jgi:hypothetical protein
MKAIALAALLAVSVAQASAQTAPKPGTHDWTVYGPGNSSCGEWTQEKYSASRQQNIAWVEGFVSGAEAVSKQSFRTTDSGGIGGYIDNYCLAHPLDQVTAAAVLLASDLIKR